MPKRLATTTRWTWSAAAACLVAGSLLAWQLTSQDEVRITAPPAATEPPAASEAAAETEAFELAPAEEYAEIIERPLFSRSRRPDAATEGQSGGGASGGAGEEAAAARISITGILLTGGHRVALLRLDDDPKVMHVAEGQEAGGWLIESIRPDKVLLRRGDAASEVILDYKRKPTGPTGAAAGNPAAKGGRGGQPAAPPPADPMGEGDDEAVE